MLILILDYAIRLCIRNKKLIFTNKLKLVLILNFLKSNSRKNPSIHCFTRGGYGSF